MKIFLYFHYVFIILIIKINISLQSCFEYSCEECSTPEYGKCTKCRSTFTLIDGTCPCSFSSCALCTNGLAGLNICEQCKDGYYNYEKNCHCIVDNCELCAEDGCKKCISGYFYNETAKECIKQNDEEKIQCYDPFCDGCFSEEKGACEYCKEGFYLKKGECLNLTLPTNGNCPNNYYKDGNYCYEKCSGVNCNFWIFPGLSLCPDNDCLVCEWYVLKIISSCDNSDKCSTLEGCLNCITNNECLICQQGYYLLEGECKRCSEGCSICSSENNCEYCMSGYELTLSKTCVLTYNFDFNAALYQAKKSNLIAINYPQEIAKPDTPELNSNIILSSDTTETGFIEDDDSKIIPAIISCDKNCIKCFDNRGKCYECNQRYTLQENKCILKCSDKNCLSCELKDGKEICNQCPTGYEINNEKCTLNCEISNCLECSLTDNVLTCEKCNNGYYLENNICKIKCKDDNCKFCSEDGLICSECKENYYYDGSKCKMRCIDENCNICTNSGLICQECENGYYLSGSFCKIKCNVDNCISCYEDASICTECKSGTKLHNGKCALSSGSCHNMYKNCKYCLYEEGCIECYEEYELDNKSCIIKKQNYMMYIIISAIVVFFIIILVIFYAFCKKKINYPYPNFNIDNDHQNDSASNNTDIIYNIRNNGNNGDLSSSRRPALGKNEAREEFEMLRLKNNKGQMTCMVCHKKPGTYKCDCGCIVCKEHSKLKTIEDNGVKYKGCNNCEKIVNKVTPIKFECNICLQMKDVVVHFKCGCAFEVCKSCYVKIKTTSDKCPGCRGPI